MEDKFETIQKEAQYKIDRTDQEIALVAQVAGQIYAGWAASGKDLLPVKDAVAVAKAIITEAAAIVGK